VDAGRSRRFGLQRMSPPVLVAAGGSTGGTCVIDGVWEHSPAEATSASPKGLGVGPRRITEPGQPPPAVRGAPRRPAQSAHPCDFGALLAMGSACSAADLEGHWHMTQMLAIAAKRIIASAAWPGCTRSRSRARGASWLAQRSEGTGTSAGVTSAGMLAEAHRKDIGEPLPPTWEGRSRGAAVRPVYDSRTRVTYCSPHGGGGDLNDTVQQDPPVPDGGGGPRAWRQQEDLVKPNTRPSSQKVSDRGGGLDMDAPQHSSHEHLGAAGAAAKEQSNREAVRRRDPPRYLNRQGSTRTPAWALGLSQNPGARPGPVAGMTQGPGPSPRGWKGRRGCLPTIPCWSGSGTALDADPIRGNSPPPPAAPKPTRRGRPKERRPTSRSCQREPRGWWAAVHAADSHSYSRAL